MRPGTVMQCCSAHVQSVDTAALITLTKGARVIDGVESVGAPLGKPVCGSQLLRGYAAEPACCNVLRVAPLDWLR